MEIHLMESFNGKNAWREYFLFLFFFQWPKDTEDEGTMSDISVADISTEVLISV